MRSLLKTILHSTIFIQIALIPQNASAEGAFKWKDAQGRVFYGGNPPPNALEVTPVSKKGVSRYSSTRMLDRMGFKKEEPVVPVQGEVIPVEGATPGVPSEPSADKVDVLPLLTQSELNATYDDSGKVTACSVKLLNSSTKDLSNMEVHFIFPDSSIVQGIGPVELKTNEEGFYEVPTERLPLELGKLENVETQEGEKAMPQPTLMSLAVLVEKPVVVKPTVEAPAQEVSTEEAQAQIEPNQESTVRESE